MVEEHTCKTIGNAMISSLKYPCQQNILNITYFWATWFGIKGLNMY